MPPTKSEAAYIEIRDRIIHGKLRPGAVLSQEALAASIGLSTTPVREGLRRLQAEGLVEMHAHRDMVIAPLTLRELHELYSIRVLLDPEAARLAAEKASDQELEAIARVADRPTQTTARGRLKANRLFHQSIYRASGNKLLIETLDSLWDRTDRYRLLLLHHDTLVGTAAREHAVLADALVKRDAERVARLVRDHIKTAEHFIIEVAGDALLADDAERMTYRLVEVTP